MAKSSCFLSRMGKNKAWVDMFALGHWDPQSSWNRALVSTLAPGVGAVSSPPRLARVLQVHLGGGRIFCLA